MQIDLWMMASGMVAAAAVVQGMTGFGFSVLVVPLLMWVADPHEVVIWGAVLAFCSNVVLFPLTRRAAAPRTVGVLLGSAVAGLPAGIFVYQHIGGPGLRLAIGVLTVLFALLLHYAPGKSEDSMARCVGAGFMAGVLVTSVAMPGPPVAFYLLKVGTDKAVFRANLVALFLVLFPAGLGMMLAGGQVDWQMLQRGLLLVPALLLGLAVGMKLFPVVNQSLFNRVILGSLVVLGAYTSINALHRF